MRDHFKVGRPGDPLGVGIPGGGSAARFRRGIGRGVADTGKPTGELERELKKVLADFPPASPGRVLSDAPG